MEKGMFNRAHPFIFENARRNRHTPTLAENRLWLAYLQTRPGGYKFRRQHPFSLYIADFYCHALQLVIEVDGSIHDSPEAQRTDAERQAFLEKNGLTVLRFRNEEVMDNLPSVIDRIESFFPNKSSETAGRICNPAE